MPAKDTATLEEALAALAEWEKKRKDVRPSSTSASEAFLTKLREFLVEKEEFVLGGLVARALNNPFSPHVSLIDLYDGLKAVLRQEGAYITREARDFLRAWFRERFGDRIRVEGEAYDLYLDIA